MSSAGLTPSSLGVGGGGGGGGCGGGGGGGWGGGGGGWGGGWGWGGVGTGWRGCWRVVLVIGFPQRLLTAPGGVAAQKVLSLVSLPFLYPTTNALRQVADPLIPHIYLNHWPAERGRIA